jgi:hypothetical protein
MNSFLGRIDRELRMIRIKKDDFLSPISLRGDRPPSLANLVENPGTAFAPRKGHISRICLLRKGKEKKSYRVSHLLISGENLSW